MTPTSQDTAAQIVDEAIAALRARGERITVPRRLVLDVLAGSTDHLSAEDLYERIGERAPGVHRATIYRTIEALVRAGVIAHVHLPHGAATYHLVDPGIRSHLHVVCHDCGRLVDVPSDLLDGVAADLADAYHFRLDADHVALTGWCATCAPDAGGDVDAADDQPA
jgi:Fur family ferric uptake transcriptional regulator